MNITEISIKRPSLIVVLFGVLILLGVIGFMNLSYELLPDFSQPVVVIKTMYPGAEPHEVENTVSRKLEDALSNLEGIDYMETYSLPNASVIVVNLKFGTNLDNTMQNAQRYIDNIKNELPDEILSPQMSKVSPNDLPIMSISATSNLPATVFYQKMVDDYLPQIQQINGVAEITMLGGEQREILIKVDQRKLKLYKISLLQVVEAIKQSDIDIPSGDVRTDKEYHSVRLIGKFKNIDQIMNLQVAMPSPGNPVYIKDVASVIDGIKEITSVSRYNGVKGIGILLKKQGDANAVDVSRLVREKLQKIEKEYAQYDIKFDIADDSTTNTIAAVNSVVDDLILAVILVSVVMLLFLHSYRNSLIVLISIPTSLITAFAMMWLLGYTLNLMTLLAMSLIIGILVDDSIVILENIQRHLDMGKDKRTAAMEGRMEIGFSALSITLVDVVVFAPILFLQVFVAGMLKQFSVVVITSTLTSLLVGFTLTPWLASRIGKKEEMKPSNILNRFLLWFEKQLNLFIEWYGRQLDWVLRHKLIFTGIVLLLMVFTGLMMKQGIIGEEMMSTGDQGKFSLNLEFDKTTTVQQNNIISQKVENFIMGQSEVETLFSNIAGPSTGIGSLGIGSPYISEFTIQLKPIEERKVTTVTYMKWLKKELNNLFPGINFSMSELGLIPRSAPIKITLSGSNIDQVLETAKDLQAAVQDIPGADNVRLSVEEGNAEYKVIPDKDKMKRLGLTTGYVGLSLRTAFKGNDDATLVDKGTEYPIEIRLDNFDRKNYEDVENLIIVNPRGVPVKVSQFAEVVQDNSPSMLERINRQPAVTLTSEAFGRPSGTLAGDVIKYLDKNPLPEGIKLTWESDVKTQNESFGALGSVMLISFILIYLIMVALYDNYIYPFVALFGIPLAVIGAFLALNLSLNNITLFALLGMIMLMGLVTKNAILIVDFTNQLKAQGKHYTEALIIAGKERMRPILMTTLAMTIGMLPIALAKGTASEWKNGLAWVIIGGLLSSLILTVFVVPMVYYTVDRIKERFGKK
ncbi:MAG TPA: efflux RND transporter permease subunit [Bacteroidetes bacterium]|nr:efflux RND transporter permease subunit [Bacteroidota bacterium]